MMSCLGIALVLGLLAMAGAQWQIYNVTRPLCDSPEAEAAGLAAQDYINAQHKNGYKYLLNQIDDIKIITKSDGTETYKLEVDLLETTCHVLDPTPLANCKVRPKVQTAVEGDCDLILAKVGGVLSVTAFKCKTEESREDICIGCATLLPLNDTTGLAVVAASLATFNNNTAKGSLFEVVEVGRMSSQVVSSGIKYHAEYVIGETNCTADNNDDNCVQLTNAAAKRGFCEISGDLSSQIIDCNIFGSALTPLLDTNATVPLPPPVVHVHTSNLHRVHGHRHHKLTALHNPDLNGLLSAESGESGESAETVVPVVPKVVVPVATEAAPVVVTEAPVVAAVVKREVPNLAEAGVVGDSPVNLLITAAKPRCPGTKKYF
ncbi:hypothetical protein UPYG_G00300060 [Umbra pygmaea]|uniref:Cystatin fetuin-A-type domain-containing protein n=1 Tax=Umbra pygmaea TaxID=75934 RepID=A0ABD0W696_UMBPY